MAQELLGIHHVTAIAGDPQANLDFYSGLLGMRLVKVCVNQDDVRTYHFFYGDETGSPGADLTFFPHPGGYQGKPGAGQAVSVALAIPVGSLDFWAARLAKEAVDLNLSERFDERLISLVDPDGLAIELVETRAANERTGWDGGPVPAEHTVRAIHSVTLAQSDARRSAKFLVDRMGFVEEGENDDRIRLRVGNGLGSVVEVAQAEERGRVALGSVHHVAFRIADQQGQLEWVDRVSQIGLQSSGVIDRAYFKSLYFREPGGVLFEIATDGPGFTIDEEQEDLGSRLALPPWLEPRREEIERGLPPVRLPSVKVAK
jgi:glyoxalase family protein